MTQNTFPKVITQDVWNDIPWQFIADTQYPDPTLCTAAFCIVTYQGKLVLPQHVTRGFEFAGGHIDGSESVGETIIRETREEALAVIEAPILFGYKKISPIKPIPHRDTPGAFYPYPHSYIPYFYAEATELLGQEYLTPDIQGVTLVNFAEVVKLLQPGHNHDILLRYLLDNKLIEVF